MLIFLEVQPHFEAGLPMGQKTIINSYEDTQTFEQFESEHKLSCLTSLTQNQPLNKPL